MVRKVTLGKCEKRVQETLLANFDEILKAFVEAAKKGGCSHVRYVFEVLGKPVKKKRGAATSLMAELRRRQSKAERAKVAEE